MPPADVIGLLHPLPVRALWGVGPRTAERLESLGIGTVGEIARMELGAADPRCSVRPAGGKLHELAWGRDDRTVQTEVADSSIGSETTFAVDSADPTFLTRQLLALTERTTRRAREAGVRGRTVSIKVRFEDFSTLTRSATLGSPTDSSRTVYATARRAARQGAGVGRRRAADPAARRSAGGLGRRRRRWWSSWNSGADDPGPGWREAEGAVDRAVARFGSAAVRPAALLNRPAKAVTIYAPSGMQLSV